MPGLMQPEKKNDVQLILGKLKGSSTSENTSDALKAQNEENMEVLTGGEDDVDASTAQEAAASSLMAAITSQDAKAVASAIIDLINLTDLDKDQLKKIVG